jgi:hypothetical protein
MSKNNGAGKRLYYCYYWDPQKNAYVLYNPTVNETGVKRMKDLSLHLFSVEKLRNASLAVLVSTDRVPPKVLTNVGEKPTKKTWRKKVLTFHRAVEL